MSDQPAPGWYADPSGKHRFRYWDGIAWTEMVEDGGNELPRGGSEPLTAEDEARLARIIADGRRAEDKLEFRTGASALSVVRTAMLERSARQAKEARKQLVGSSRHLVAPIANAYIDQGADLDDLMEEGNVALRRAAQAFDKQKQARFMPYAAMKIHQAMVRALHDQARSHEEPADAPRETKSLDT
jgi:DNA-directed RNA polymerase sigma subunit (sigma70/sigma32)